MTVAEVQRFGVELRAEVSDDGRLIGRAAVFGQIADMVAHYERIGQRAFDRVLADATSDVRALINHNPAMLLGRQSAGTLRLRATDAGLEFEVDLPDTSYANDLRALVARGDMTGASFGFIPGEDTWSRARDGRRIQTHLSVSGLRDVSIVTFPAYEGTEVHLRSLDSFEGLDLADFDEEVDPPTDEPVDPPAGPTHRSSNRSRLVRARARIHLSQQGAQQ